MIISTRGRYALRVMLDLAENGNGDYIAMKKIAERQGISLKYLERILPVLTQNNIVEGVSGKGGGYRLTRQPEEYKVGEILRLTISLKYLERILPVLTQNNIVEGVSGKGGGYRLTRQPEEYKVGEILRLTEGDLAPVACLGCGAKECARAENCKTQPMWKEFYNLTNAYFDGITLSALIEQA